MNGSRGVDVYLSAPSVMRGKGDRLGEFVRGDLERCVLWDVARLAGVTGRRNPAWVCEQPGRWGQT